ncbi:MAG: hypothetical protein ABSH19_05460 [Opitutales bacterium]|jgi:myosin heavy subunit
MNAVSQALRIIAIVAALATAGLYFLSEQKTNQVKALAQTANTKLQAAQQSLADANAKIASDAQDLQNVTADRDKAKADAANYATLLTQARNAADTATHAAQDKDAQIQDLNTQIASLKQQVASIDDLKQQIATLQAAAQAAQSSSSTSTGASATPDQSAGNTTATGNTTASTAAFSTTATPTQIIQLDGRHGLIVVGVGSNSGIANDAQLVLQKSGVKIAEIQVTDAEPDYSVAMILTGSTVKALKKGDTVDFLRVR